MCTVAWVTLSLALHAVCTVIPPPMLNAPSPAKGSGEAAPQRLSTVLEPWAKEEKSNARWWTRCDLKPHRMHGAAPYRSAYCPAPHGDCLLGESDVGGNNRTVGAVARALPPGGGELLVRASHSERLGNLLLKVTCSWHSVAG